MKKLFRAFVFFAGFVWGKLGFTCRTNYSKPFIIGMLYAWGTEHKEWWWERRVWRFRFLLSVSTCRRYHVCFRKGLSSAIVVDGEPFLPFWYILIGLRYVAFSVAYRPKILQKEGVA